TTLATLHGVRCTHGGSRFTDPSCTPQARPAGTLWWPEETLISVLLAPRLGPRRGFGDQRVVRPVVLGVAALEVLLHLGVGVGPEAGQVLGDLYRPVRRRQQVQFQAHPAA